MSIHSAPAIGPAGQAPVQPAAQAQPPAPAAQPAPLPPPPQLRTVERGDDPRGTKRERETESSLPLEPSDEPVVKQARTEPMHPAQQALFDAIDAGDKAKVESLLLGLLQSLLTSSMALINAPCQDNTGETPLCRAARRGTLDIVTLLLNYGASVNARARDGSTPLMLAAQAGHIDVIRMLVQAGADVHTDNRGEQKNPPLVLCSPLMFAIKANQFEACKCLIELGANVQQEITWHDEKGNRIATPLGLAIARSRTELIGWLLDAGRIAIECIEHSSQMTLVNAAARFGAIPMVRYLAGRGAFLESKTIDKKGNPVPGGVWRVASDYFKGGVIEDLLRQGYRPAFLALGINELIKQLGNSWCVDLILHAPLLVSHGATAPDGLADASLREQPHQVFDLLAPTFVMSTADHFRTLDVDWCGKGLSTFFINRISAFFKSCPHVPRILCGKSLEANVTHPRLTSAKMQQVQILLEFASDACGHPALLIAHSGRGLTAGAEQAIKKMLSQQRDLILQGIAHIRTQFDQQVASLPDLCMNRYISVSHRLNEEDLYRTLAEDWGLYDPIARAVLRLVKDAYERLRHVKPEAMTPQFAALSPAEQLKTVIASVLEEWDKIPEIVEAIGKAESPEEMETVSDLLFQQWRLFQEALGVTKERPVQMGPRRRNEVAFDQMTGDDPS